MAGDAMNNDLKIIVYANGNVSSAQVAEFVESALDHVRSGQMGEYFAWRNRFTGETALLSRAGKSYRLDVQSEEEEP